MIESPRHRQFVEMLSFPLLWGMNGCAGRSTSRAAPEKQTTSASPTPYEASRQRMLEKFGDRGAELRVDAFAGQEFFGVEFFADGSDRPFYAKSLQGLRTRVNMMMPLHIPERVTVVWREAADKPVGGKYGQMTYDDRIIGSDTIEVGSRIPQEVLDSLRRERGLLRLKFRLSNDGVYFGWDIERRPGYDPRKLDSRGNVLYIPPVYFMTGGDFKEARGLYVNGKRLPEKGWYIDKKTGQKIEVDF